MRQAVLSLLLPVVTAALAGVPVRVVPCSSWSNHNSSSGWSLTKPDADGAFAVQNRLHGEVLCLHAADSSSVVAMPCDGSLSQQWHNHRDEVTPGEMTNEAGPPHPVAKPPAL